MRFESITCIKVSSPWRPCRCSFAPSGKVEYYRDVRVEDGRVHFYAPKGSSGSGVSGETLVKSIDLRSVGIVDIKE